VKKREYRVHIDGAPKRETVCTRISEEFNNNLTRISRETGLTKAEILRGALQLLFIAYGVQQTPENPGKELQRLLARASPEGILELLSRIQSGS